MQSTMASTNSCINNITTGNSSVGIRLFEVLPHYTDFIWLLLVILIFIPNIYLLLLIVCTRRLRTRSNALISSLAMLDIMYALFYILPMSILLILHHHGHQNWTPLTSIICQSAYNIIRPILDFNINLHICVPKFEKLALHQFEIRVLTERMCESISYIMEYSTSKFI